MAVVQTLEKKHVNKEALIMQWREDPVLAAEEILGVELDTHQRLVMRSRWRSSRQIDILSRGTGKSFMNAVSAVLRGILYPGHRIGIIGPSYRQSKVVWGNIENLYEKSPIFQECCVKPPVRAPEACTLKFSAAPGRIGSYIAALPMGPDGAKIRGERFYDVYADEAAQIEDNTLNVVVRGFLATSQDPMERVRFMREQREMIAKGMMGEDQLVMPEDNKYILSSTAYYQFNHLWRRVSNMIEQLGKEYKDAARAGEDLSRFQMVGEELNSGQIPFRLMSNGKTTLTAFTCLDPSEGFINLASIEDAKKEMDEYLFKMEYFSFFPPDSQGFFRRHVLDAARNHHEFSAQLSPRKGMKYVLGIDPARSGDNFAIAVFEVDPLGGVINLVRMLTWNNKHFPQMHQNVRRLIKEYDPVSIGMDAGGGGTTIRDLLADKASCPPGHDIILEREFDGHMMLTGRKILDPLFQFSSGDLVHDANHNLLNGLEHSKLRIADIPPVGNEIWTQEKEDADEEIEKAIAEMSTIVKTVVGQRERWDTPSRTQRKDRYSAILIGYHSALKVLQQSNRPQSLAVGGWA